MKNKSILFIFLIATLLNGCISSDKHKDKDSPNIVFIMSDDHAYQAISCYDGSLNETPNIDRLANEGVRFVNSFCTNSICAPSRAVMLTGKYSHINGHIDNKVSFDGSQQTFPKLLQKAGYQTAMIGKWHLKSDPTGFDYWNILPGQGHYYNPDFIENGVRKRIPGYVTDITTDIALNWLDGREENKPFCLLLHHKAPHRNWMPPPEYLGKYDNTRFPLPESFNDNYETRGNAARQQEMEIDEDMMLAYDLKVPVPDSVLGNFPFKQVGNKEWGFIYNRLDDYQKEKWESVYQSKNNEFFSSSFSEEELAEWKYQRYMQDYLACIASVDDNIGRVLDYLEKKGLTENTIVVYTSDQGFYLGEHGWFDKRFIYEQSLRMPLIIRYPKEIKPAVNENDMVLNLDFASTFLDFAGIQVPDDIQGKSLRKVLMSKTPHNWRDAIYYRYYEYPGPHSVKRHYGIRTHRFKLIHFYYDVDYWELYDMYNDPLEVNNLYENPGYAVLIDSLKVKLEELQIQYSDTAGDKFLPQPDIEIDHLAKGCTVSLTHPFHIKYAGGKGYGLTNGFVANPQDLMNNGYSAWQGFEGADIEAIIDLGKNTRVSKISCGFLQNANAWIFLPPQVAFYFSNDAKNYTLMHEIDNTNQGNLMVVKREMFETIVDEPLARYIKVVAKNVGVCPDWHPAAGNKAWLFADEVVVE